MSTAPQVFDCFTFSNELDLLEFRLNLLRDVVDRWVIVEADHTHSGLPKPLAFAANQDRFQSFHSRIVHVVVDDLPAPNPDRWVPERFQRRAIMRGLGDARDDDIVLISDADEIPDPSVIVALKSGLASQCGLQMRTCYQMVNWEASQTWPLVRAIRRRLLDDPEGTRQSDPDEWIAEAGTHFTYLMEPEQVARKFSLFAHDEYDTPRDRSAVVLKIYRWAALSPTSGELLSVRKRQDLSSVQLALADAHPEWVSIKLPPTVLRLLAQRWTRARRRAIPLWLVWVGDVVLLGLTSIFVTRRRSVAPMVAYG